MAVLKTTSPSPSASAPSAWPMKARPSSSTSAANFFSAGNDHHLVVPVFLGEPDLDVLHVGGRDVLAHVVRPDRKLPMAAVDKHRQLDGARAPEVHERIHRRPRRAAVVDHVVDQDHDL